MGILSKCVICDVVIADDPDRRGPKRIYCDTHRDALSPKQRAGITRMRRVSSAMEVRATAAAMDKASTLEPGLSAALAMIQSEINSARTKREKAGRRKMGIEEFVLRRVQDRIVKRIELGRTFPTGPQI